MKVWEMTACAMMCVKRKNDDDAMMMMECVLNEGKEPK